MEVEAVVRKKWRLLKATMDERARRLWAGTEADAIGWGGVAAVARATGLAISTVRKGRDEARRGARSDDLVKVRRKGGGRRSFEVEQPDAWSKLENLVDPVTRGDPESPLRWTCKSTHLLAREMFIRYVSHQWLTSCRSLDAAFRVPRVSRAVRLGQGLGGGLFSGLTDVVVDGLADDAGGQVAEVGVELLGEGEVLGPEGIVVELLGCA